MSDCREAYGIRATKGFFFSHESPRRVLRHTKNYSQPCEHNRDWGFAKDYVEAMWLMVARPEASDYVIATGETHSVRDFVSPAFAAVRIDPKYYRPSKARKELGWKPKTTFAELVRMMVIEDLKLEGLDPERFLK